MKKEKRSKKRKLNKKAYYFLIAIVIIVIIIISVIVNGNKRKDITEENENNSITLYDTNLSEYVKETEDGIKINTSTMLTTDKILDEFTIKDIQLTFQAGITSLSATVTNNSDLTTSFSTIKVTFLDEKGKELSSAKGVIRSLGVGESTSLNISMSGNFVAAHSVKFSK